MEPFAEVLLAVSGIPFAFGHKAQCIAHGHGGVVYEVNITNLVLNKENDLIPEQRTKIMYLITV